MTPEEIRERMENVRRRLTELQTELERKEALLRAGRDVNGDGTFDDQDAAAVEGVRQRRDAAQARLDELQQMLARVEAGAANAASPATVGTYPQPEGEGRSEEEQEERREENERLATLTPEELAEEDLIEGDIEDLFSEDYMRDLMTEEIPGEGSADLADLMTEIERGLSGPRRTEVMQELAQIVGVPPSASELDGDYGRFLEIRRQQDAIGAQNNSGAVPGLDDERHPEFQASRGQLLFGKVLGDAFGIHEVFASLLSPTGGLVGPGNDFLPVPGVVDALHLSPDNPVALHGTMHDAGGYLKAYHNEGPGYNYREDEYEAIATEVIEMLPAGVQSAVLPLTGQISGIAYWVEEGGDEYLEARYDEAVTYLERELSEARDSAADAIAELLGAVQEQRDEALEIFESAQQEAEERMEEAEEDLRDLTETVEEGVESAVETIRDEVQEQVEAAGEGLQDLAERAESGLRETAGSVQEQVEAAGEQVRQAAETVGSGVLDVLDAFEDAVERAASTAVETFERATEQDSPSMTDVAQEKLDALSSFIWS